MQGIVQVQRALHLHQRLHFSIVLLHQRVSLSLGCTCHVVSQVYSLLSWFLSFANAQNVNSFRGCVVWHGVCVVRFQRGHCEFFAVHVHTRGSINSRKLMQGGRDR